jgi:hypothetical protein
MRRFISPVFGLLSLATGSLSANIAVSTLYAPFAVSFHLQTTSITMIVPAGQTSPFVLSLPCPYCIICRVYFAVQCGEATFSWTGGEGKSPETLFSHRKLTNDEQDRTQW